MWIEIAEWTGRLSISNPITSKISNLTRQSAIVQIRNHQSAFTNPTVSNYQVLARKWRPQRFEDVIGQRGVTQTLRNAIAARRIAQSFVFSGPRGVGKTTTARILARALNCEHGPTAEPCGTCDACVEIAQGRDMDVLEIDAATNTQVDKVRDVIIAGLSTVPVRNRYKVFIIDEVHRLSPQAFDALLKSIEEPPPHVVFMMATTELDKVPATIQSRSQVFELKTIAVKQIADQLRHIADAERIQIDDDGLMLIARAGDGSMRDAQSAFDQVIAFAGDRITASDVSTVLGLVRRDLLFDIADAVAQEDGPKAFELSGQAIESGYDLRQVVRELARLTRDLLVVRIDASRLTDPELAAESERDRLKQLAAKFAAEDLMRAFDVLTKAEADIRGSAYPRYHLEMAILRWIHLRKLVPLSDLIHGLEAIPSRPATPSSPDVRRSAPPVPARPVTPPPASQPARPAQPPRSPVSAAATVKSIEERSEAGSTRSNGDAVPTVQRVAPGELKESLLNEIRKSKKYFYGTVVAQAQRIDIDGDHVVFTFAPQHRAMRDQLEQSRSWLDGLASQLSGRKMTVAALEGTAPAGSAQTASDASGQAAPQDRQQDLRQQALADSGVQAMLDVFAAEIKDVEERK
ncbi:MAG: DNA polymerase III subunit gamma/tau [Vicinamibacterales bacterium]